MIPIRIVIRQSTLTSFGVERLIKVLFSNGREETRWVRYPDPFQDIFHASRF